MLQPPQARARVLARSLALSLTSAVCWRTALKDRAVPSRGSGQSTLAAQRDDSPGASPEPRQTVLLLSCEMSLSVWDWGCHGAVLRAAIGGITWAIATGHLHPPLHKESHCLCCLTPPCPNLVGFGGGGGVEGAVGGASMAPKWACPLNALSLRSTQGKVWVGGQVPGQQLGWSVVSAASLVEGA